MGMPVSEIENWAEMFLEENLLETMLDGRGYTVEDYYIWGWLKVLGSIGGLISTIKKC